MLQHTQTLSLRIKKGNPSKIHFVVPKNIIKSAVKRNLIKRRLRSATKDVLKSLPPNKTILFYTKNGLKDASYKQIKKDIKNLLDISKITTPHR